MAWWSSWVWSREVQIVKQYRRCEIEGCGRVARPYRYTTCWRHSAKPVKESRLIKTEKRKVQMNPNFKPDPSQWVAARSFCQRNCGPPGVGHHCCCAFWLWNRDGSLELKQRGPAPDEERHQEILNLRKSGMTYRGIGEKYGLTRQRVEQIVNRTSPR